MKAYLNESVHLKNVSDTPIALRERRILELQQSWESDYALSFTGFGPGYLNVDITKSTREQVLAWLAVASMVCVDLEPADIRTWWGQKDAASLTIVDALANSLTCREFLSRLTPDEVVDRLTQLAWRSVATPTKPMSDTDEKAAIKRLEEAGILVPPDNSEYFEVPPEPMPTEANDEDYAIKPRALTDLFDQYENIPSLGGA